MPLHKSNKHLIGLCALCVQLAGKVRIIFRQLGDEPSCRRLWYVPKCVMLTTVYTQLTLQLLFRNGSQQESCAIWLQMSS